MPVDVSLSNVAISGATGLIGARLRSVLQAEGVASRPLVRRRDEVRDGAIFWSPQEGEVDAGALRGCEAVVHLAGESVAGGRWNDARKARIRDSRVLGTRLLVDGFRALSPEARPQVLLCASAVGYYGDRGDETLTEAADAGDGFLAEVCQAWETEALRAEELGLRVVRLRIGIVLAAEGGALSKMKTPFRLGVGGVVGSGEQYMSWIHLEDVVGGIRFLLRSELSGVFNAVAPSPVTNRVFTKSLGRALSRPAVLPMPALAARAVMGAEMADEMLLSSARVVPERLLQAGFAFRFPELDSALADVT